EENVVIDQSLPDLPIPLANTTGALIDGVVYVAGGTSSASGLSLKRMFQLDLNVAGPDRQWVEGPAWPGPPRMQAVSAGLKGHFYLFSGFQLKKKEDADGGIERILLHDSYRYIPNEGDPTTGTWELLPDAPRGIAAAPVPALTLGQSHILIAGGLDAQTLRHTDMATHPGFVEDLIAFHVERNEWVDMGRMPSGSARVTAPTVQWNDLHLIINGESGPGVRSPEVYAVDTGLDFGVVNWIVLLLYLIVMVVMGIYFSKRERSTANYFLAGGRIPWWAAGISIYGTQLSAITFMAIPAVVYVSDWRLSVGSVMILLIVPIIIKYYLPFFRRLNITTAYEYLEQRFDLNVRILGSLTFILLQLGRMGVVLYLPAIAIASVTGIDVYLCILIMGTISTAYTVLGGIEAVVWTDVIQVFVLLGGAITAIIIAIDGIDGGVEMVWEVGMQREKFRFAELSWDPTRLVLWVGIVGFFFLNLISYTSDQVVIQRYLTVKSEKEAARSLWTNGLITIPVIPVFFGLGTVIYIYYLLNPTEITSTNIDEILPFYIVTKMPIGVAGLVIAGIFAASMSSLDSSMNSISTAYITDFHKRIRPGREDQSYLRIAKYVTVLMGFVGTFTAMWIAASDVRIIFDFFQELLGMIGGSLAGVFVLAVFTRSANAPGAIIGTFAGAAITLMVKYFTPINGYLYGAIGVISCVLVGLVASRFFTSEKKQIDGVYRAEAK
ncbi:MAG: sodium/solute symporter, partial [Cyclobacteriaceae bacterium]|nr:sodium/solute symporter [Cyclobacteriaceae bacterium]